MQNSGVIIVSNDKDKAKSIALKIVLLRSHDIISILSYDLVRDYFSENKVDLVLLYAENMDDLEIIPEIKALNDELYIILITDDNNPDILCRAFDLGIDDYTSADTNESLFFMRVMWGLKRKSQNVNMKKITASAVNQKIIDVHSGFYLKDNSGKFLEAEYNNILKTGNGNSFISVISSDYNDNSVFSSEELAEIIQNIKRLTDTAGFLPDNRICMILNNTTEQGAEQFYERLKKVSEYKGKIYFSGVKISDKPYPFVISVLNNLHTKDKENNNYFSLFNHNDLIFQSCNLYNQNENNVQNDSVNTPENIINLIFSRKSVIYQSEFSDTQIFYSTGKNESTFTFKSDSCYSKIKFNYGESKKIRLELDYIFYGQEIVEGCEINYNEFSFQLVQNIIDTVANTYKRALENNE